MFECLQRELLLQWVEFTYFRQLVGEGNRGLCWILIDSYIGLQPRLVWKGFKSTHHI